MAGLLELTLDPVTHAFDLSGIHTAQTRTSVGRNKMKVRIFPLLENKVREKISRYV